MILATPFVFEAGGKDLTQSSEYPIGLGLKASCC